MSKGVRVKAFACPECRFRMDGATCISEKEDHTPQPGDITICSQCCSTLVFTTSMEARIAEETDLKHCEPEKLRKLRVARRLLWQLRIAKMKRN